MEGFGKILEAKGAQNRGFGISFGVFFRAFGRYGDIVKTELSLERELNPKGWRGSEIR